MVNYCWNYVQEHVLYICRINQNDLLIYEEMYNVFCVRHMAAENELNLKTTYL